MTPDAATTTSTPGTQAPAPDAPAPQAQAPAAPLSPVQIFWDVAWLAFGLLARLSDVLHPVKARFPKQAWQIFYLCTDIPRILLTIRYAPERITMAQLRHLTRARHLLQALFGYTFPTLSPNSPSATNLGPRTSSSATATANQHPSPSLNPTPATPLGARTPSSATTPSPAVAGVRQVSGVPEVSGAPQVAATPASPSALQTRQAQNHPPQSALGNPQSAPDSHTSQPSHSSHASHSAFSPYIPDYQTLLQALKAATLPASCAGALLDAPGDALVKALHQLHAIYFSLYPNQPPTQSPSPSPSQSSSNLQSPVYNPQSDVQSVQSVHSPSPAQSEISNLKSEIPDSSNPQSDIPHSTAPP